MRFIWESLGNTIGAIGCIFILFVLYTMDTAGYVRLVEPNSAIMLGEYLAAAAFLAYIGWRQWDDIVQYGKREALRRALDKP